MVKFSCLLNNRHYHSSKESVQQSVMTMQEAYVVGDQPQKVVCVESNSKTLVLKAHNDNSSNTSAEKISSSSSVEQCWKSEEMMINFSNQRNMEVDLKGSQSVGSGLDSEGKNSSYIKTEDEKDQGLSYDDSQDNNYERMSEAYDHNELMESLNRKDPRDDILQHYDEAPVVDKMYTEAILAVRDLEKLEKEEYEESTTFITSDHSSDARDYMPHTPPLVSKYCSSDMGISSFVLSRGDSSSHVNIEPQSRSSEDGGNLDARRKVIQTDKLGLYVMEDEERDKISKSEKDNSENLLCERFNSDNVIGSVKDLVTPKMGEIDMTRNLQGDSSVQRNDNLPSKEFKIKRIEEWISMIDLEDSAPLLDEIESPQPPIELTRDSKLLRSLSAAKLDAKPTIGIEVAKHYISSLTAISATAQLANHGLVVMPLLSAFVSLKVLNLSGNSIVRITSGALPRGLHMLNLSKNNISTIEGLRELTRLRVLDLSYNRISRIGHGLAYCSAIKELYLAGNKISEVEGLQRLLKLKILDLHFNKISTAKCFGQLVANYGSLQSISVEGNPAQKNVGDEQVKKFLQSILPNLACYNKQSTRSGSSTEHIDRTSRSAIATSNQSYRGLRSEHKLNPKGSQKIAIHKPSSSARHG